MSCSRLDYYNTLLSSAFGTVLLLALVGVIIVAAIAAYRELRERR